MAKITSTPYDTPMATTRAILIVRSIGAHDVTDTSPGCNVVEVVPVVFVVGVNGVEVSLGK